MTYPDNKTIENWIFNCKLADFEFSTTKEIHYLWKIGFTRETFGFVTEGGA
jgi:hypothetical protein